MFYGGKPGKMPAGFSATIRTSRRLTFEFYGRIMPESLPRDPHPSDRPPRARPGRSITRGQLGFAVAAGLGWIVALEWLFGWFFPTTFG